MKRRDFIKLNSLLLAGLVNDNLYGNSWAKHVQDLKNPKPIKIALLGLGNYSTNWLAPAIVKSKYAELTAIITGSKHKIPSWQNQYNIKDTNVYDYDNFDQIKDNRNIDCVYIVTPPGNHADFSIRSSNAGKHVICEKPMAMNYNECTKMIQAAKKADKSLQIGYRLYWDPFTIRIINAMRDKEFGSWNAMSGGFGWMRKNNLDKKSWNLDNKLSLGGALGELGVYCVQSSFYVAQTQPVSVMAKHWTKRKDIFVKVPEQWEWELTWPNGLISKHSSGWGKNENYINVSTAKGDLSLQPAYSYSGNSGVTPNGKMNYINIFQQKLQIDGQCLAILNRKPNITPGEMGRRDIKILEGIIESANTGKPVKF